MFNSLKYFFQKNIWIIIPIFFWTIFAINFPFQSYVAGWDGFPLFYTSDFIYQQLYSWTSTISYGAVWWQAFYVLLLPYIFLVDIFKHIFWDFWAQYLYFWAIFVLPPLWVYFLLRVLQFSRSTALLWWFFYGLSFLTWSALTRNVIPITNLFVFTPFIAWCFLQFFQTDKKIYLLYLFIIGIFNIFIISNPWTFGVQFLVILIFIAPYIQLTFFKKLLLSFGLLYWLAIPGVILLFTMLFNSQNLITDDWNNVILKWWAMAREMQNSVILNTIRWFNGDLFAFWWYRDATESTELYYPFLYHTFYKSTFIHFLSFVPVFLIICWLIFLKKNKRILIWFGIFMLALFLFKWVGNPFWNIFHYCLDNVPMCGIFRSPHQKFSIIFLLSIIILLALIREKINKNWLKRWYDITIVLYIFVMWSFLFFKPYITELNLVTHIPESYKESTTYINNDSSIKNIIILPFNESTWINTEFGFEGYSLFSYLLPQKQIYNRNDLSFSSQAKKIHDILWPAIENKQKNILNLMNQYNIDTLVYDAYTDRYARFLKVESHEENIAWLNNIPWLVKAGQFEKIHIYHIESKPVIVSDNLTYIKNNSTNYSFGIKNLSKQDLYFLQSFHADWKLYLEPYSAFQCENFSKKIWELYPTTSIYVVQSRDTIEKIAKKYNISISDIEKYNLWINNKDLKIWDKVVIPDISTEKKYSVLECETKNIFYNWGEISKIWKKNIAEKTHKIAYEYANAWQINADDIKKNFSREYYKENEDGSIDIKVVLYFKPQSYFYVWMIISFVTLLTTIAIVIMVGTRKKINKKTL